MPKQQANMTEQDVKDALQEIREKMLLGGKFASSQNQRQSEQRKSRAAAEKISKPILLRPNDLSGDWDGARALKTTLNGKKNEEITDEIIAAFKKNIETIQKHLGVQGIDSKQGITPFDVLDFALDKDLTRAEKEIFFCAPFSRKGDVQRFMTNASQQSKHNRHYVDIQFLAFNELTSQDTKPKLTRQFMASTRIKFDCTCEHHQYRRRYIATIGKYAYGEQENAYPKWTNPNLIGISCKHVLRVMQFITSALGVNYLQLEVDKVRKGYVDKASTQTASKIKKRLEHQEKISHHQKQQIRDTLNQKFAEEQRRLREQERMAMNRLQLREAKLQEAEKFRVIMTPDEFDTYVKGVEAKYPL